MYAEARKIHLIEEVLKVKSTTVLMELESVLKKNSKTAKPVEKPSIYDFVGILSKKETNVMRKAIAETCETMAKPLTDAKALLMEEIRDAVEEMKLIRAGKKKAHNADDFLIEL